MIHGHITTWVVGLLLFIIAVVLRNAGNKKGAKIVHMVLRLFYVLIILTGVGLLFAGDSIPGTYLIKGIVGIWVIGAMEMVLVRSAKEKSTKVFWIQFIVAVLLVLYLGLSLPQGWQPFL